MLRFSRWILGSGPRTDTTLFSDLPRLSKLLQPFPDAPHIRDAKSLPPSSAPLVGTAKVVIDVIVAWVSSSVAVEKEHIFYLTGCDRSGKSAIAQELCNRVQDDFRLVASLFFYGDAPDRNQMGGLPNALAMQLAKAIPEAAPLILAAVDRDPGLISTKSGLALSTRFQALFCGPFEAIVGQGSLVEKWTSNPYLIVIDGLDECEDKEAVEELLNCMLTFFENNPSIPLRVFITSRIDQHTHARLDGRGVRLKSLDDHVSGENAEIFTYTKGDPAYKRQNASWRNSFHATKLMGHLRETFTLASCLPRFAMDVFWSQNDQSTPMSLPSDALDMDPGLDALYSATLTRSKHLPHFPEVISVLALAKGPLPVQGIAELLGLPTPEVLRVLVDLQAIIRLPCSDHLPVTLHHPSLRDFLTTESRAACFYTPPAFHLYLFLRCFIIILKHRQHSGQSLSATAYSKRYEDIHWREAECAFEKQTARSRIFKLCSKARRCPPLSESHALYLDKIGIALLEMVNNREVTFPIDWVASLHREALEFRTSLDAARALTLDNLGIALCRLFEDTGNTLAVEEAISRFRETRSLRPSPHPHLPVSLNNLGNALYAQFQQSGHINQILEAIGAHREALRLRLSPDLNRSFSLENLGNALLARYEHHGAISDVEEAIGMHREALSIQDRTSTLSNLGDALRSRGEHFGRISDHDEAIYLHQRAHLVSEGCPSITRCWILMNTGISFYSRSRISGSVEDLMQAISFLTQSLNLISSHHIYRQKALRYLIISLQALYERNQSPNCLEEAIKHTQELLAQHYTVEHRHRGEWLDRLMSLLQMKDVVTDSHNALNRFAKAEDNKRNDMLQVQSIHLQCM